MPDLGSVVLFGKLSYKTFPAVSLQNFTICLIFSDNQISMITACKSIDWVQSCCCQIGNTIGNTQVCKEAYLYPRKQMEHLKNYKSPSIFVYYMMGKRAVLKANKFSMNYNSILFIEYHLLI